MTLEIPVWLMWSIALILSAAVPAVCLAAMSMSREGVDGSSEDSDDCSYEWTEHLTEGETIVLAHLIMESQLRQRYDKDIASIY